jgi:hypothetical protein
MFGPKIGVSTRKQSSKVRRDDLRMGECRRPRRTWRPIGRYNAGVSGDWRRRSRSPEQGRQGDGNSPTEKRKERFDGRRAAQAPLKSKDKSTPATKAAFEAMLDEITGVNKPDAEWAREKFTESVESIIEKANEMMELIKWISSRRWRV